MTTQKTQHVDEFVGKRLREARLAARLTQTDLAGGACSAAYISRIELGERAPSLQLLRELGKRLRVSADYLAAGRTAGEERLVPLVDAEIALRLDEREQARGLFEQALSEGGDDLTRLAALAGLGNLALREGRHRDAIDLLQAALEAHRLDAVDHPGIAETLARSYAAVGELSPAIALLQRCVEHYEQSGDVVQYIRFAALLGYALTDNGEFGRAEDVVAQALVRGHGVVDVYARARLYWAQSRLLAEQGLVTAAEGYARKTLETLRVTEDTFGIARAIETLAHICIELGRPDEALTLLAEGDPLMTTTGSPPDIAHFRLEQARALAALGEHERAAALAMQIAGQLDQAPPVDRGRAYLLLADLFKTLDEPARAKELYELAIECAEAQAPGKYLVKAYQQLAELLRGEGDRDAALDLLERAVAIQTRTPQTNDTHTKATRY